jgi:ABC-type polysaccharide/polyol phosphate transport system ATPase subunit
VEELKAIKYVSFPVKRGETLGIIGRDGAGETARLKILSPITEPPKGIVDSLLKVGTGIYPELTGRENELPLFSATQCRDAATCSHARRWSKKGGD